MTVQLTTNIAQPNIVRWRIIAFDVNRGVVTFRFESGGGAQGADIQCTLLDAANQSSGVMVNPSPQGWNDKIVGAGSVGAANSLTNAQNAYRSAANHGAGLKAVELQALTDGWVPAVLTGT